MDDFFELLKCDLEMIQIRVMSPSSPDAAWCLEQYFLELGRRFDSGFNPSLTLPASAADMTPPCGLFLVAYLREKPVGCAGLKFYIESKIGMIKRMWVAPEARGQGFGRRMLNELELRAKAAGISILRLETNQTLKEAIDLYRKSGYREVAPFNDELYADFWFEKRI